MLAFVVLALRRPPASLTCWATTPNCLRYGRRFVAKSFCDVHGANPRARDALLEAITLLREASVPEAEASARWLLAHVLGSTELGAVDAAVTDNARLSALQVGRFRSFVQRRLTREPVQFIVGRWAFHDIDLELRPPVLVPRPETEELVDLVLDWWWGLCTTTTQKKRRDVDDVDDTSSRPKKAPARFLDVGCGSGALGLALLKKLPPGSTCRAIDISLDAVSLARQNAAQLDLADRYVVERRSAFVPKPPEEAPYDFIVSNPPYIPTIDLRSLEPEVRAFEDPLALDGGGDGLDVARAILDQAPTYLDPDSTRTVWFELDSSHPLTLAAELKRRTTAAAATPHEDDDKEKNTEPTTGTTTTALLPRKPATDLILRGTNDNDDDDDDKEDDESPAAVVLPVPHLVSSYLDISQNFRFAQLAFQTKRSDDDVTKADHS
mmetsp:Transcript_21953/g.70685  ORF Transcript_21953/g.70685 Transcript_21953/m.70685 type:complete len:437 (+) Transcript_21953:556-1866(+)